MSSSIFGDFLGWCLALLLPILAFAGPLRRDRGAGQAYLIVVLLHIVAAAVYVYLPGILPTRGDTNTFHNYAILRQSMIEGHFSIGSGFYEEYLAQVYSLVGPSFFFGAILSIYAFALSVLVLAKFMEILDLRHGKAMVILIFGALPTSVLYGTVPMREPYQVLFFILACYYMVRFRLDSRTLHLIGGIIFALMMGLLHKGLIVYAPILVVLMLLIRVDNQALRSGRHLRTHFHRLAAVALAIGFLVLMSGAAQKLGSIGGTEVLLSAMSGEDLVEFAEDRRDEEALTKGRTAYGAALNTSSPIQFVYSSAMILFYYMFAPFPWQVRNALDIYAFGEVILRVVCLWAILRMWRRGGPVRPQMVTLLMVVYFSMAFLWAAGTTNYGTATRHHMIHQWILLLLGVPALVLMRSGFAGGGGEARTARPQGHSRRAGSRLEPRTYQLRSLMGNSSAPPRLGGGGRQARGFGIAPGAPRLSSQGAVPPRRLT
jgi:hypothetical protein